MNKTLGSLLLLSTMWQTTALAQDYVIDFELNTSTGSFEAADWLAYGLAGVGWTQATERAVIDTQVAHGGKQSLKIFFPKSAVGPSEGGHQATILLKPEEQYYLSYWLKFDENYLL